MPRKKASGELQSPGDPGKTSVRCCCCRGPVDASGWCAACAIFPGNANPVRRGSCGDLVDASGWCHACKQFTAPRLEYTEGQWIDTHRTDTLLDKAENQARMRFLLDCIGKGDKAKLLDWAKRCAKAQPGRGWEQCVQALEAGTDEVPF